MAGSDFHWSEETYRLDEIGRRVDLPQLVQLTEGIDTGSDVESFSAEDIMMIDQCVTLQKVAAQFAEKLVEVDKQGSEYAILKEEILIPLNYKGELKVVNPIRRYYGVRDLARDFPRYATVLEKMQVPTETGGVLDIVPGTTVELDRVIPGRKNECDKLVISTASGGRKQVAVPLDMKGRFRSCPDENAYTLKEVIDRYSLPKVIQFLDNKIQKIYTQDLLEGIEQMANITGSALQINRIILQNVLIGHYTEPGETNKPSAKFCKRTLIVIPLDSLEIREITVRVRISNAEDDPIYEPFLVQNVNAGKSDYVDVAEGLYVEFLKRPRIIRLKEDDDEPTKEGPDDEGKEDEEDDGPPPPIPPRPGQPGHGEPPPIQPRPDLKPRKKLVPKPAKKPDPRAKKGGNYVDFSLPKEEGPRPLDDGLEDYEIPDITVLQRDNKPGPPSSSAIAQSPKSPTTQLPKPSTLKSPRGPTEVIRQSPAPVSFQLADVPFGKENVKKDKHKDKKALIKLPGFFKGKKAEHETGMPDASKHCDNGDAEDEDLYDEPDDISYDYAYNHSNKPGHFTQKTKIKQPKKGTVEDNQKPVARVSPQANQEMAKPKEFRLLKNEELEDRLIKCGMKEFAKFCAQENLDGDFLYGMDDDTLKSLGLSKFNQKKLKRIMSGWIPTV